MPSGQLEDENEAAPALPLPVLAVPPTTATSRLVFFNNMKFRLGVANRGAAIARTVSRLRGYGFCRTWWAMASGWVRAFIWGYW
ncbi:hypothetical protein L873DRAFT_1810832 [Choiromyces venosus 120613-1]|uniref:Uncharacterized protein n=1 Tax=Choiromyces venosus 120613-1 TaxID=1336337 RepID=A0A3N4JET8_9PEZI|nr:hypothetical protein L873DRAFT_1810832 [Choiromyces venosus 120613-1]